MTALRLAADPATTARVDVPRDERFPGGVTLAAVPTHGERIHALFYRAAGAGTHPVLVLLHGFPGVEQNGDLAHAARRAGWHVIVPRYRGAWGSPGAYAWTHVLEDAAATVAWVRRDATALAMGIDPRTVAVAGHSLGGFAALTIAADDPAVAGAASFGGFDFGAYTGDLAGTPDAVARTAAAWDDGAAVLHGTSGRALADEAFSHGAAWALRARARDLAGPAADRPLLLVAASDDDVAPPALHHAPLVAALRVGGARALTARTLTADHSFADVRFAVADLLLEWLAAVAARSGR